MKKYLPLFFYLVIGILAVITIYPIIYDILWSIILSYFSYPLFKYLYQKTKNKVLSALIVVCVIGLVFILLMVLLIVNLVPELYSLFLSIKSLNKIGIIKTLQEYSLFDLTSIYSKIVDFLISKIPSVSRMILDIFLIFVLSYYFLIRGEVIVHEVESVIPLKEKKEIFRRIDEISKGIVYGYIFGAGIQALISYIGFWLLGYRYPALYSVIVFMLSILPIVGPWTLWIPLAVYKIFMGDVWVGIISILYSLLIVGIADDVLRPKVISYASKIDPMIAFIGVFGGIFSFGPIGLFIGPISLSIAVDIFLRYKSYFK